MLKKTQDSQPMGEYVKTEIDRKKQEADFLITDINGNYTSIRFKNDPQLTGWGIRKGHHVGLYYVTASALKCIKAIYKNYQVNF